MQVFEFRKDQPRRMFFKYSHYSRVEWRYIDIEGPKNPTKYSDIPHLLSTPAKLAHNKKKGLQKLMKHVRTEEGKAFFKAVKFERAPRNKRKRSPEPLSLELRPGTMSNMDEEITEYDAFIPEEQFLNFVKESHPEADVSSILAKIG